MKYAIINNCLRKIKNDEDENHTREVYGLFKAINTPSDKLEGWYLFFNPNFDWDSEETPDEDEDENPFNCFICFSPDDARAIEDIAKKNIREISYDFLCDIYTDMKSNKEDNKNE